MGSHYWLFVWRTPFAVASCCSKAPPPAPEWNSTGRRSTRSPWFMTIWMGNLPPTYFSNDVSIFKTGNIDGISMECYNINGLSRNMMGIEISWKIRYPWNSSVWPFFGGMVLMMNQWVCGITKGNEHPGVDQVRAWQSFLVTTVTNCELQPLAGYNHWVLLYCVCSESFAWFESVWSNHAIIKEHCWILLVSLSLLSQVTACRYGASSGKKIAQAAGEIWITRRVANSRPLPRYPTCRSQSCCVILGVNLCMFVTVGFQRPGIG